MQWREAQIRGEERIEEENREARRREEERRLKFDLLHLLHSYFSHAYSI